MPLSGLLAGVIRLLSGVRPLPPEALPRGPTVFFANHSSHLDFAVIWAALPPALRRSTRPVAGRDYWEKTAGRRWLASRVFNAVLIERQKVTTSTNPLGPMVSALDAGGSLIVFPEGTRSMDGEMHEFKGGLHHLAKERPDVPLVPIYLNNLNRMLPKGEFIAVPLIASVSVGQTLRFDANEPRAAFLARARSAIVALGQH